MTEKELEIAVTEHEMQRLELKESFDKECIETACAFANAGGGYIVLGVDNTGTPAKTQLRFEALRDYENRIATATEPSVAVDAEKLPFQGGLVVVLKVTENPLKPVAYKGRSFVRKGSVNHQMSPAEIAESHLKSTGASMDAVIVPGVTRDDLDMGAVRKYMEKATAEGRRNFSAGDDPWAVLKKLEWVKSETEITRAAYLLFAKEPQIKFPQAIIHAGAFKDGGSYILDSKDIDGNIQDQVDETLAFIKRNIRRSIVVTAKAEHDRYWDYPIEALRETVTNAICHRDYGSPHDIQIKILEDKLVVHSPGQLPFDMSMPLLMMEDHPSRPRNRLIAQAFYDIHLIEHYGSGIRRIKDECDANGNAYPIWRDDLGTFSTTYLPRNASEGKNTVGEGINGSGDTINNPSDTINGTINEGRDTINDPIKSSVAPINEGINATRETVNETVNTIGDTINDTIKHQNDTINPQNDTIKSEDDTIKRKLLETIIQNEGLKRDGLAEAIQRSIPTVARLLADLEHEGKIIYRGSKKTGGYYAVKQED